MCEDFFCWWGKRTGTYPEQEITSDQYGGEIPSINLRYTVYYAGFRPVPQLL